MEVVERLVEVPVDALADNGGVEVLADVHAGAVVEQKEGVQHDVEAVHGELELPLHPVDELELDGVGLVVAERYEAPAITVVHFDHFGDIGLLQCARGHSLLGCLLR